MAKYVFVTGGVVSGLGKGITASSIALLLKAHGYKVFMQKFDPYINVDPGTMSPYQHGEVFVTADGTETDLDLGHYERFIDEELNYTSNITLGKVMMTVIEKERRGDYLGGTVQIVPHVTNEIKNKVYEAASSTGADIVITEIGGTNGDIESEAFFEALRQIKLENHYNDTMFVHTTLVPALFGSDELKTKPTQHSVIALRSVGIQPDMIVCRTPVMPDASIKAKIGMFCSVPERNVVASVDVNNIYEIPLLYHEQEVDRIVLEKLGLDAGKFDISQWKQMVDTVNNLHRDIHVALVGKYTGLLDAYISVVEALKHAGFRYGAKIHVDYVSSEDLDNASDAEVAEMLKGFAGICIPGGFGGRGIEGMIKACKYARTNNVPFLGLCLGMQIATIEFARNVCGMADANSTEFHKDLKYPVICLMEEQKDVTRMGGTLRLGNYECRIVPGTLAEKAYGESVIMERHRHRYEYNNEFRSQLEAAGLKASGINPKLDLVEMVEIPGHRHFIACQFHPEFKSRPVKAHPLFASFINAVVEQGF
ncbi:MAG: CTP synthase [Bacteroidaceae bacterium]|nr:CTP synthase [Bacteroidaceae bacterium]